MAIFKSSAKGLIRVIHGKWPNLERNSNSYSDPNFDLSRISMKKTQKETN